MSYRYFISFSHEEGFGNMEAHRKVEIQCIEDINDIKRAIEKEFPSVKKVIVLNYKRFKD